MNDCTMPQVPQRPTAICGTDADAACAAASRALRDGAAIRPYARSAATFPACDYFVCLPSGDYDRSRLFVSVHGITRNALEHALLFRPWVERLRVPMIAPLFPSGAYARYQTLGGGRGCPPADEAFAKMVEDASRHLGLHSPALRLFGHSGGGQFAHRYALRHPHAVDRLVIGAAGWYTFPDADVAYPRGFGAHAGIAALDVETALAAFPPTLVVVGAADRGRDDALNRAADIDRQQGRHRLERAQRWVDAMAATAVRLGRSPPCALSILPGASHAFGPGVREFGLDRVVAAFLFPESQSLLPEYDPAVSGASP